MSWSNGEFRPVATSVHVATLEPESVNVGLVIGERAAALIDSGSRPDQGRALLKSARVLSPVPVTHVVVTHGHHDHLLGVAGMDDVTVVGHETLSTGTDISVDQLAAAGLETAPVPDVTFSLARTVDLGGVRLELLNLGGAHTQGDVLVWIPERNTCFAGDLLEESGDPQFSAASNIKNWPTVLDGVLGAANDDTVFVPGHGQTVNRMFAFQQRAEIGMLYGQTEMLIEQGTRLEDAAASTEWPFTDETLAVALPLIYAELEAKGIKPRTHLPLA